MAQEKIESRSDVKPQAKFWQTQLKAEDRQGKKWRERGRKVVDRYRDERDDDTRQKRVKKRRFNILWANTETLKPAIYSQTPIPDVRRRFLDQDPVGRRAAELIERSIAFSVDDGLHDFDVAIESARDDMLLPGRGQVRVKYKPFFSKRPVQVVPEESAVDDNGEPLLNEEGEPVVNPQRLLLDGVEVEPDGEDEAGPFVEAKVDEAVWAEYVFWEDYRQSPARSEKDVWWKAYRHRFTRKELKKRFKKAGADVQLDETIEGVDDTRNKDDLDDDFKRAVVWEIWDRQTRKVYWVHESHDKVLRTDDDPLRLQNFFPSPPALVGVKTTNTWVPVPEYTIYQDQAEELDKMTERINTLIGAIKARGAYPDVLKQMDQLLSGDDNEIVPIGDWESMQAFGGLDKAIAWVPVEQFAKVLISLYQQRDALKQEIYELTGLSDLIRGATKASETATAQRLKGNFGTLRMTPRQKPVQRFVRDIFRMMAEIIAEHFSVETMEAMTGLEAPPEVRAMLAEDKARGFRIDIETDSTVQPDADAEKQRVTEFMTATTAFIQQAGQIGATAPQAIPMLMDMLKFAVRPFKVGRTLEQRIEETAQQLSQQAQQLQGQQQQPSPEQIKAQTEAKKAESDIAVKQADIQLKGLDGQIKQAELQIKQVELQLKQIEAQTKAGIEAKKADADAFAKQTDAAVKKAEITLKREELDLKQSEAKFNAEIKRAELEKANQETPETNGKDSPPVINLTVDANKSVKRQISFERGSDGKITGAEVEDQQ